MAEHFRHRFLQALLATKLISQRKATDLLSRKHSGFHIDSGGEAPVAPHDTACRRHFSEYLLRAPFSLQKVTWNPDTKTVVYRSRRSWHTKRNFEVFKAPDFLAAAIDHIPPKGQQRHAAMSGSANRHSRILPKRSQTVRYYGLYSDKTCGLTKPTAEVTPLPPVEILPARPKAPCGATSSSVCGAPIRSNARAALAPCSASKPSPALK